MLVSCVRCPSDVGNAVSELFDNFNVLKFNNPRNMVGMSPRSEIMLLPKSRVVSCGRGGSEG